MKCKSITWVREPIYEAGKIVGCLDGRDRIFCRDCRRNPARKSEQPVPQGAAS